MAGPVGRVGAALALSVVLAAALAMVRAGVPGEARAAPAGASKDQQSPRKVGSGFATGLEPGQVDTRRYWRASELESKPVPLTPIEPAPPAGAEKKTGRVIARILINESGAPDAVRIESSEPRAVFDEAVKSAFGSAFYRPGVKGGRSVKSQMLVEVTFHGEHRSGRDSPRPR